MFTFGSSSVLDLDNARLFAQQFQLEEDSPTLRRIARSSALCHHDLVQCLDASRFIVRSQNDPDVQYEVVLRMVMNATVLIQCSLQAYHRLSMDPALLPSSYGA